MHNDKVSRNRMGVLNNLYQGKHKKVLTVCSAGCLRSPTAAHLLASEPFNFNTRCCGVSTEYAIVPLDGGLVMWADEIVCMDENHAHHVNQLQHKLVEQYGTSYGMYSTVQGFEYRKVHVLDVPDKYEYRDPELVKIMLDKFYKIFQADLKVENN